MKVGDRVREAYTGNEGIVLEVSRDHAIIKFTSGTWRVRRSNWKLYEVVA